MAASLASDQETTLKFVAAVAQHLGIGGEREDGARYSWCQPRTQVHPSSIAWQATFPHPPLDQSIRSDGGAGAVADGARARVGNSACGMVS
jgi:hypothetical protein